MANNDQDQFKKVLSHAKEYGYVLQSSEIYDGLQAVYDYGQNGAELKKKYTRVLVASDDAAQSRHCRD